MMKLLKRFSTRFINSPLLLIWSGRFISSTGDFTFDTVLVLWIATVIIRNSYWSPIAVSGVLFAVSVPTLLIGPIAGVFVDRWDKRLTMLWMDMLRALLTALLIFVTPIGFFSIPNLWRLVAVYSIVFLASSCSQFFNPASLGFITGIIDEADIASASSLLQMATSIATFIGPALGSLLFFTIGIQWAIALNALSFVVSFLTILALHEQKQVPPAAATPMKNFRKEISEGICFLLHNSTIMTLTISATLVALGGGALSALDVFFVTQNLHTSAAFYGLLGSALGGGMVIGAFLASLLVKYVPVPRIFQFSLIATGVMVLVYARLTNITFAAIVIFLIGLLMSGVNATVTPLVLGAVPTTLIGRVVSIMTPLILLASLISTSLAGFIDSVLLRNFHITLFQIITLGPVDTIFTATGILIMLGGLFALIKLKVAPSSEKHLTQAG